MFHIVYKTTNEVNNKVYIGKHSTTNIDDGYLGSGVALKNAVNKYGKENFNRRVLKTFDCELAAYDYESKILTEAFIKSANTYNMTSKRHGSYSGGKRSAETRKRMSIAQQGHSATRKGQKNSPEHRRKISETLRKTDLSKSDDQLRAHADKVSKTASEKRDRVISENQDIIKRLFETKMNVSDMMKETGLSRAVIILILKSLDLYKPYSKGNRVSKTKKRKRPTATCPHCGKTGGDAQMKQWHFDKCKLKAHKS